jgi:hypothetical protein
MSAILPVGTDVRVVMHPNSDIVGRIGVITRAYGNVFSMSRGPLQAYGVEIPNSCGPTCGPRCWTHPCKAHEVVPLRDPDTDQAITTEETLEQTV